MLFGKTFKRIAVFLVAMAAIPVLFGNAFHYFSPCAKKTSSCCAGHDHGPCDSDSGEHRDDSTPSDGFCPVCEFLAMPRDVTFHVAWDCFFDLLERQEPEAVRLFVSLYRPFEPGRAPPDFFMEVG